MTGEGQNCASAGIKRSLSCQDVFFCEDVVLFLFYRMASFLLVGLLPLQATVGVVVGSLVSVMDEYALCNPFGK